MPLVSIIVPCYNEETTIQLLLEAICRQTLPLEQIEVVLADGMSGDRTREKIANFQATHPELAVRVVDNPKRAIPSGLNRAIEASLGEFLVRLDAHSIPAEDYVERCLQGLREGRGDNVGGVWEIRAGGKGAIAQSIAAAAAHPMGVGDALYRFTTQAAYVDTVPFGSFRAETIEKIGLFDETLLTNEDYELNTRLRQRGGRIWLDPHIRSGYIARATLPALARQYFRYGYWKLRMLRRYPRTLRLRQALPPLFVLSLAVLCLFSLLLPVARFLLLIEVMVYLIVLFSGAVWSALRKKEPILGLGIPLAITVMHLSWGSGFLVSILRK